MDRPDPTRRFKLDTFSPTVMTQAGLEDCRNLAVRMLEISNEFRATINTHHGVDPWSRYKIRRVPQLQWFDPSSSGGEDKASLK
jgi:hypothetical protein